LIQRGSVRYTKCMVTTLGIGVVRASIRTCLEQGTKRIQDVALELHVSRSTLQRRLAEQGTDFTRLRRAVQTEVALEHLKSGRAVVVAARRALVCPDHLRRFVREETGLTPGQIARAVELADRVQLMREQDPPSFGTPLYRLQMRKWHRIDAELDGLLGDIGPTNPLADWAKGLLLSAERPDFRRQPYRNQIREKRKREREELETLMREFDRWFEQDDLPAPMTPKVREIAIDAAE
jgi:AraC-like DNA-binding protein